MIASNAFANYFDVGLDYRNVTPSYSRNSCYRACLFHGLWSLRRLRSLLLFLASSGDRKPSDSFKLFMICYPNTLFDDLIPQFPRLDSLISRTNSWEWLPVTSTNSELVREPPRYSPLEFQLPASCSQLVRGNAL
jgi:hypothetical protein